MVECLPVYLVTWVRFPAGTGKICLLYDNGTHRGTHPRPGTNALSLIRNDSLWPETSGTKLNLVEENVTVLGI